MVLQVYPSLEMYLATAKGHTLNYNNNPSLLTFKEVKSVTMWKLYVYITIVP